jgi:hypothetical protein
MIHGALVFVHEQMEFEGNGHWLISSVRVEGNYGSRMGLIWFIYEEVVDCYTYG